jgi:hypothetical protein
VGVSLLAVLGCGTTRLTAKGRQVVAVAEEPGERCAPLGTVTGFADPFFGGCESEAALIDAARNDAANRAADLGATHLRFHGEPGRWASGTFGGGTAYSVTAVAYRCREAPTAATPGAGGGGCAKDTDCKGERICEAGACVDPHPAPPR